MPTPIDPKKLPRLRATMKRFDEGQMLPQQELAKIYGVSNARLTTLIHERFENFPKPERRGDKTHWYEARPAIGAMISYLEGTGRKKQAAASAAARVMGAAAKDVAAAPPPAANEEPVMTPAEIDRLASAQTRIFRLEQEKRAFVRADTARGYIRNLFATVQRSVSSLVSEIDPNGELPPLHRSRLESAVRDAMVRIHGSVAELIDQAEDEEPARAA